jgi:hypothetical protein
MVNYTLKRDPPFENSIELLAVKLKSMIHMLSQAKYHTVTNYIPVFDELHKSF